MRPRAQVGYWRVVSGFFDIASYPLLIFSYAQRPPQARAPAAAQQDAAKGGATPPLADARAPAADAEARRLQASGGGASGGAPVSASSRARAARAAPPQAPGRRLDAQPPPAEAAPPGGLGAGARWALGTAVLVLAGCLNGCGVEMVGNASIFFTLLVLAPFCALVGLGWSRMDAAALAAPPPAGSSRAEWGGALSVLLWNLSYFDLAGTFAAEVRNAQAVFLPAMLGALALALLAYGLPLCVGMSVSTNWADWAEGHFVEVRLCV